MTSDDILRLYVEAPPKRSSRTSMTHEEIVELYTKSVKESYSNISVSNVWFKESKTPIRGAVLVILNNKLFWMACNKHDDSIFPAYGPLESFDHAHAVITMRGYTLDG